MYIVPVIIKYENNGKQITTYAMLDNCSQGSFVHQAILNLVSRVLQLPYT